ncbi:DUF892 family protein [Paracoccus sp. S-4012]|uniref:YciE/YciF ferroxidase family protein n=1 Tax=Paracoccus sp. S-4012 TaxID=2665648 RepID=UPI0012B0BB99|nr:ferritin-like domain-containing protein [Paracoccus sp. S-4012]MRX50351.1 DUF892 family protein [Paracoccus sp. S-4012]
MAVISQDIQTLDELFLHTLQDVYYAENQILKALPKMSAKASDPDLKAAFDSHLHETDGHVRRLEQVFGMLGLAPRGVDCPAMDGIIREADEIAAEISDKSVLDGALAASAQTVEHYEIARYGTLIAWARELGREDAAAVLQQNLDEEYAADRKLTQIAEARVNRRAR